MAIALNHIPTNVFTSGMSQQPSTLNAHRAEGSGQDDYSNGPGLDHQLSLSTTMIINHLADRLAVRLEREPALLRREMTAVYALYKKDFVQLETAPRLPDPPLPPLGSRKGDLHGSRGANERVGSVEPIVAQLSHGLGHNRKFSFQLGDDPGAATCATEETQGALSERSLHDGELSREHAKNTDSTEATNHGEESPLSNMEPRSNRARREPSNRSVMTAIKHSSIRSTHSSSSLNSGITRGSPAPSVKNAFAMAAARVAGARSSSERKSIDSDDRSTCERLRL